MAGDDVAIWERFIASKVQKLNSGTQNSSTSQANILGTRSFNLSSGSIALNADADMQGLMCDLTIKPASEILTDKSSRELARRSRYVDFVRLALACCRADPDGRAKKVSLAVKSIEVRQNFAREKYVVACGSVSLCIVSTLGMVCCVEMG